MKIHFAPDYGFTNPMHRPASERAAAVKDLKDEQHEMKGKFSPQIMIDSEPESERPWSKSCENFTGLRKTDSEPGIAGPGCVFVLSDPAPFLEGGFKSMGERGRDDGTKDYWSISAIKLRVRGAALDLIVLDGDASQTWDHDAGAAVAAEFMAEYTTGKFFSEDPKRYLQYMLKALMPTGISLTRNRDGSPLKFEDYNKSDGKNSRSMELCTWAREGRVWICRESCRDSFLYGDGEYTGLLTQCRKYRKIGPNKTNLRYDDHMDNVARGTDAALQKFAPRPHIIEAARPLSPFTNHDDDGEGYTWGTRHVRA